MPACNCGTAFRWSTWGRIRGLVSEESLALVPLPCMEALEEPDEQEEQQEEVFGEQPFFGERPFFPPAASIVRH